ncbi:MAG: prepilin-type N-terminal cleavage/methylation domain-containing protein [Spirochaetales bacterium]|nr:prepilin-type N-terminal cleavage/methylation domain-containing protein [Spirochaetales bacterium]
MIKYKGYQQSNKEDGSTFIELLVAITIMSILGVTMWMGFATTVHLIRTVPESTRLIQEFIALDSVLREYMSRVRLPFWQPELDFYTDSSSAQFPFYEGVENKFLLIEFYENEISIKTFEEESDEDPVTLFKTGPFSSVTFNEVTEKGLGLIGIELTLKPEHEKIDEFTIFARFGGFSFEKS